MAEKPDKIEALREKERKLKAQIAALEAQAKAKERKEDTRLKVIMGAALLADSALHPETAAFVSAVLTRAVKAERDREFLKAKGWLSGDSANNPTKAGP